MHQTHRQAGTKTRGKVATCKQDSGWIETAAPAPRSRPVMWSFVSLVSSPKGVRSRALASGRHTAMAALNSLSRLCASGRGPLHGKGSRWGLSQGPSDETHGDVSTSSARSCDLSNYTLTAVSFRA